MRTLVTVLQRQNASPSVVENACMSFDSQVPGACAPSRVRGLPFAGWSLHNLTAAHDEEGSLEVISGITEDAATASAFLVRGELLVTHAAHASIAEAALWALATLPTAPDIGNPSPTSTFANATLRIVTTLSAHSAIASAAEGALWALVRCVCSCMALELLGLLTSSLVPSRAVQLFQGAERTGGGGGARQCHSDHRP